MSIIDRKFGRSKNTIKTNFKVQQEDLEKWRFADICKGATRQPPIKTNKMKIESIEDLLNFIDTNYERLSDKAYVDICRSTMHLYEFDMPDTKEATLNRIAQLYEFSLQYPTVTERPLFLINN